MTQQYNIPRLVFVWLLISQSVLLLPHIFRYPWLLLPLLAFCTFWRIAIFKGKKALLKTPVKLFLLAASLAGIVLITGKVFSIDSMVLLLVVTFLLKVLEIKQLRDLLLSLYLAYFLLATQCLYDQGLFSLMYLLLGVLLITGSLIASYSQQQLSEIFLPLKETAKLMALSLPLMLVAFMLFPRIGPLWSMPSPNSAKTGISDSMSPGKIAQLAESDELVFRATFQGPIPNFSELYWRALSLSVFDGQTWRQSEQPNMPKGNALLTAQGVQSYHYQLTMEASHEHWIYVLDGVQEIDPKALAKADYSFESRRSIDTRQSWYVTSAPMAIKNKPLSDDAKRINRYWPAEKNPKTSQLAKALWRQSSSAEDYLTRVLAYFKQQGFAYSLNPPVLSGAVIDEFLFASKIGFCEHFAMAFAGLARAAGLPARVVLGYQGGDINPYQAYVAVKQLNAHAWVEVWLNDRWQRYDPTYSVAPRRIDDGGRALEGEVAALNHSSFVASVQALSWAKKLQYRFDQLNYLWHRALSYDETSQNRFLSGFSLWQLALSVLATLALTALCVFAVYYKKRLYKKRRVEQKIYRKFLKKLAKKGLVKQDNQGALEFSLDACLRFPEKAPDIKTITWQYNQLCYAPLNETEKQQLLAHFKRQIDKFTLYQ